MTNNEESLDVWGFKDTSFRINPKGHVELSGTRYELSGQELPNLFPWVRDVMGIDLNPFETTPLSYPPCLPEPIINQKFVDDLQTALQQDQISFDANFRLRHGHGHTLYDMYAIKNGGLKRIPDVVVFPSKEEEVILLVEAALRHNVCLIPFGGGTCVTEALRCPENENRMIVSVDMKKMNKILWIDKVNHMACIEAGAVGRDIMEELKKQGFTMGHEPDSVEFSTLGGWIATNASGMKKNKYGNIEDLVLDMRAVTPAGKLTRTAVAPRESVGIDPKRLFFGSEGSLGIITSAVVKIFPLPEVQRYGSIVFPDFEKGVSFLYELMQETKPPASVRLVDNPQFQFSLALKNKPKGFKVAKSQLEKFFVTKLKGFDPKKMVACTLVFEGKKEEVASQEKVVYRIAKKHNGLKAGAENGKRGYQLTFSIAYIRDFILKHYILAESFETSVLWSKLLQLCAKTKQRVLEEHQKRNLPGKPFISCRVTQVYETGVCVYFYFGFYFKGVSNPMQAFAEIEHAAREEILRQGGSLSHHHGVGKLRQDFLPTIKSEASLDWIRKAKETIDPNNIFGCGNQLLGGS
ncbi:MAG: oxidase [Deltaproteobacteria bacterium RIFCSPLOWO2_12_FULL_44_12]|nr:MAG: oxidase [Deltaproteobacteria bacterium RIFCSPHIGHO2_01_FULL_43_49]OGQ14536.1 MAG: oxidase [Deltaproteobacteria bacterium RIFCSPHIGHO2_02_FULL_44_53]OGQ27922.1 MAG: oxidase [Deltaproteobacteria bacterium RIFCSPHIGHO2_12_FULL_44_21]OGQ31134.1 MAG: oxidase [Deltaproteobacteria bacterium RIFCSPLOWO2_01_FULL_45_74]OGQ43125.1 MAG: oxidase [Deltaproteobacteria bacterium RIFCSPLOWO2_02_FULL_44_34]OGQ69720.1 MAG: oxidase [Deltaproteobacteria bacterium RIFCSPLOWO2_12_FULL_44_12]